MNKVYRVPFLPRYATDPNTGDPVRVGSVALFVVARAAKDVPAIIRAQLASVAPGMSGEAVTFADYASMGVVYEPSPGMAPYLVYVGVEGSRTCMVLGVPDGIPVEQYVARCMGDSVIHANLIDLGLIEASPVDMDKEGILR